MTIALLAKKEIPRAARTILAANPFSSPTVGYEKSPRGILYTLGRENVEGALKAACSRWH